MKASQAVRRLAIAGALVAVAGIVAAPSASAAGRTRCYQDAPITTCYTLVSTAKSTYKTGYADSFYNGTNTTEKLNCRVERTTKVSATFTAGFTASVKAPLVAEMDASVSASVGMERAMSVGSSVNVTVPPHRTGHCTYGLYTFRGKVERHIYGRGLSSTSYIYITAPSTPQWRTSLS